MRGLPTVPVFWWHTLRSLRQARKADGILHVDARVIGGVHHTLTAWKSREAMIAFLKTGAHLSAMRRYPSIGRGRTLGFETNSIPNWREARLRWEEDATEPSIPKL